MQLVSVKPGTKIDNAYCRDEVVMEELSDDSMIKLTSFSRTMNCLIIYHTHQTVELLHGESPDFTAPDMWPGHPTTGP